VKDASWLLHNADEWSEIAVGGRFRVNSMGMVLRMATLDMGIVVLFGKIVAEDVAQWRLRRILIDWACASVPITLARLPGHASGYRRHLSMRA
jgi:DNA-binding transcriptional LysR family regulator